MLKRDLIKIKRSMAEKRISQRVLAIAVGVTRENLNRKLNGRVDLTADEWRAICNALGIELNMY